MTDEELRILTMLAEGHPVPEIGRTIGYGERTVRRRLHRLLAETDCISHTHLAVWATACGLIEPTLPLRSIDWAEELAQRPRTVRLSGELRAAVGNQQVDDIDVKGGVL